MSKKQENLSKQQLRELRDAFDIFDRDRSGSISASELKQVLVALNFKATDGLLRKLMKEMDTDGSGSVEFEEFARAMADVYKRDFTDDEMRRAFQCFDADNSGFITTDELQEVLRGMDQNVSAQQMTDMLRQIDTDQDGKISYEEFVRLLQLA